MIPKCYSVYRAVHRGESVPTYYLRKLSEPIHDTPRNITFDNWFTSIELFIKMKKNHGLTMVGTIPKNKFCNLPNVILRLVQSDMEMMGIIFNFFAFISDVVLEAQDGDKLEMIDFYNETKCGTDVFDQLYSNYTCIRRQSNLWPVRFLGIVSEAGVLRVYCTIYGKK